MAGTGILDGNERTVSPLPEAVKAIDLAKTELFLRKTPILPNNWNEDAEILKALLKLGDNGKEFVKKHLKEENPTPEKINEIFSDNKKAAEFMVDSFGHNKADRKLLGEARAVVRTICDRFPQDENLGIRFVLKNDKIPKDQQGQVDSSRLDSMALELAGYLENKGMGLKGIDTLSYPTDDGHPGCIIIAIVNREDEPALRNLFGIKSPVEQPENLKPQKPEERGR